MWRTRAVLSMLIEEIAHLTPEGGDEPEFVEEGREFRGESELIRSRRRAMRVVILDWSALILLLLTRGAGGAFLTLGPTQEAVFTLAALAVAVHSGFRLGQIEKLRSVERACRDLMERREKQT